MAIPQDFWEKISIDVRLLGDILGDVIQQQAGSDMFKLEERIRRLAKNRRTNVTPQAHDQLAELTHGMSLEEQEQVTRAFTVYFELINLAEEHHRARVLRKREQDAYPDPVPESIGAAVAALHQSNTSPERMQEILHRLQIELVFTAHPTEAKRRTIVSKLRRITRALRDLERPDLLPVERDLLLNSIRGEVTSLWVTDRSRTNRPDVEDEVRMGLFYFNTTLWDVVPNIYRSLANALAEYYPDLTPPERFLTFGSWMGGDRDGNPYVTHQVTATTLSFHRRMAAERHHTTAQLLDRSLSASNRRVNVSARITEAANSNPAQMSAHLAKLKERYPHELYRLIAANLADDLLNAAADDTLGRLTDHHAPNLESPRTRADILAPLQLLNDDMQANNLAAVANTTLKDSIHLAQAFGLHAARLDIRQFSAYNRAVLDELLAKLDIAQNYADLPLEQRTQLLTELLQQWPPDLSHLVNLSPEATETLDLFRLLRRVVDLYGPETLGPYIISMTNGPDDLLAVLLLARWAGLCLRPDGNPIEGLAIVPLFETRADLQAAPKIMSQLFTHPTYAQHLERLGNHQMIMIGYSDSNKDAGYITAKWELYAAQEALNTSCDKHGIELTLFHGKGGTIARGGGPTNRGILALPDGTVRGRVRITEQGEVINDLYGNPVIARRHLEQIVNAVLMRYVPSQQAHARPPNEWRTAMDTLSLSSYQAYRKLVYETPELLIYWQQATPINVINQMRIGSRPARRGGEMKVSNLRAIPWVFSWMQSRHVLPGWYGLGTALENYITSPEQLVQLQDMYQNWSFFRNAITNAQLSIGKTDMGIARLYSELVEDDKIRKMIFNIIHTEYERTVSSILRVTGQREILENDPVLRRSIKLRNPYVDPLNFMQVSLLRQLRSQPDPYGPDSEPILQTIFLTINGVAAGLKNTG